MTCRDVLDLVEAIAGGDVEANDAVRAHLESCPRCAAELASARRIDAVLGVARRRRRPLHGRCPARIRRERWRSEQQVDRIFNVAIVAAVLLVAGGVAALMNVSVLVSAGGQCLAAARGRNRAARASSAAPSLVTYISAAGLLLSAP
jgi:anti-sigma factor RsiW